MSRWKAATIPRACSTRCLNSAWEPALPSGGNRFGPAMRDSMGQRIDRDVERELLAVLGTNTLAAVARVIGAERAAKAVLAHDCHQVPFVENALQLDVPGLV